DDRHREAKPLGRWLRGIADRDNRADILKFAASGKERRDVTVWSNPKEHEIELHGVVAVNGSLAQFVGVAHGRLIEAESGIRGRKDMQIRFGDVDAPQQS